MKRAAVTSQTLGFCFTQLFACCVLAVTPPLAWAQTSTAAQAGNMPTGESAALEKVTITAEKRITVLDTTPAAITVLSGSKLTERGASNLSDIVTLTPNTTFATGQGASQIFIRGIGNVFFNAGGDPGVALYVDGSYVSDQTSSNAALFDTQRVEVLRGPQGALYGRNATGGAMNIISLRPTDTYRAQAGLVLGNHGRKESEGYVSGPVANGATKYRLSYQLKEFDGYTTNPLAGLTYSPVIAGQPSTVGPERLDDLSSRALRLQVATDISKAGNLRLILNHYREQEAGPGMQVLNDPVMVSSLLFGARPSADPRSIKSQGSSNSVEVNTVQALYEQQVGTSTLGVTLSWRKSQAGRFLDADATEASSATTQFATRSNDRSLDVHLASDDASSLQWLVGANYLQFDQQQDIDIPTQVPLGFIVPGQPVAVPFPGGIRFLLGGKVRARSGALYTDLRYAISPALALLGGLRVNHETKGAEEYQAIAAFGVSGTGSPQATWTSVPGNLGIEYKFSPGTIAYGRVSHGFKSGAVNLGALQPALVKPETVTSLELGVKSEFWGRRGILSVAAFSSNYKDMQVSQVGVTQTLLANASAARISGLEIEASLRPFTALTLSGGIGLMDPKYTEFTNTDLRNNPTTPVSVKGNQLAQVSKAQVALSAEYALKLAEYAVSLRGDYVWRSKFFFTEFNTPDAMQPAFGMFNLSASLRTAGGAWKVHGYVKNASNTTAITSMSIYSPLLAGAREVTYTRPRELGLGLTVDF